MKPSVLATILVLLCSLAAPLYLSPAQVDALNPGVPGPPQDLTASPSNGAVLCTGKPPLSRGQRDHGIQHIQEHSPGVAGASYP